MEKVNNMVLFDQATYDKLLTEAPMFKLVTPSILSDRLRVCFPCLYVFLHVSIMFFMSCSASEMYLELYFSWHVIISCLSNQPHHHKIPKFKCFIF
jgi:hypothetical protein